MLEDLRHVERAQWHRYLFYVDLAVVALFVISLILLIRHSFMAGQWYAKGEFSIATDGMWLIVADTVFLTGAICWIFFRFFRNQYLVLTKRF